MTVKLTANTIGQERHNRTPPVTCRPKMAKTLTVQEATEIMENLPKTHNPKVVGSNPASATKQKPRKQAVFWAFTFAQFTVKMQFDSQFDSQCF